MTNAAAGTALPTKGLWRRFLILIPLVAIMAVGCYAHIRSVCSTYEAWTPVYLDGVSFSHYGLDDRSATTNENMEFSRKVIEERAGRDASELLVGFSTTNYHVFRGYVCAHRAGMVVQGMGSRTRAYFWPNAFLREFAGLLASRWKGILITYAVIGAVYALASYALLLMGESPAVFMG